MSIQKILIACRGEIALRITRTCKELGLATVGVYTTVDSAQMHLKFCDETVCIGEKNGYISVQNIISAALTCKADAIHPGYGFLSENAQFAKSAEENNILFIGPKSEIIAQMGDKLAAKTVMTSYNVPCVPGSQQIKNINDASKFANKIGYPVIIKAAMGGGGRGMQVANNSTELNQFINKSKREAKEHFGDDSVYIEKYLDNPRHVEVQILADNAHNIQCLGTRDCSIQRRHQKLIEEAPAPNIPTQSIEELCNKCIHAAHKIGYTQAGTFEFLYQDGSFYFIEMNTRIQVEHPVTEMITGIDIVKKQLLIAQGHLVQQGIVRQNGHAIELRICAENPQTFIPSAGTVTSLHVPGGYNVRFDSHLYHGYKVPVYYDSLVGKLIAFDHDRESCIAKLKTALNELIIKGIDTNIELFQSILEEKGFSQTPTIHYLNKNTQGDNNANREATEKKAQSQHEGSLERPH